MSLFSGVVDTTYTCFQEKIVWGFFHFSHSVGDSYKWPLFHRPLEFGIWYYL